MKVSILGHSGFIGKNLVNNFSNKYDLTLINIRDIGIENLEFHTDVVINLIGKAHDLKNTSNPNEYYEINTNLCNKIFDKFLYSNAHTYIYISTIKSVSDGDQLVITENTLPNPKSHYGISKFLSEKYINQKKIPKNKRIFILRPTLIHGPENKGNLNLLYNYVNKDLPWILANFENKRSFCYIENLIFVIDQLIVNNNISSNTFNVSDDIELSTNQIVELISNVLNKKVKSIRIPKPIINLISKIGDYLPIYLNSDKLNKLTQNFVVSNDNIKKAINKPFPFSSIEGLNKTFKSFKI